MSWHKSLSCSPTLRCLDVDNGLPGVELWFGHESMSKVGILYHLYSCATMNTGNLHVHQRLVAAHPHLVGEYIEYNKSNPFQPLQLSCVVKDLESVDSIHGKLITIVRYWLRYQVDNRFINLSFGLGSDVAANSIIGLPILWQWVRNIDFGKNIFVAPKLKYQFPLIYEPTN